MFVLWLTLTIIALAGVVAIAASTNTVTTTRVSGQNIKIVRVLWHDNDTTATGTDQLVTIDGFINQVITTPHVSSTIQPQDNYDVYLYHGNDTTLSLLGTNLENRDTANTEIYALTTPVYARTVTVSHVNSSVLNATGAVDIYVTPTR